MHATRATALQRSPRRYATVYVPEQGLTYRLRSLTERERQHYVAVLCDDADDERRRLELLAYTLVDDAGDLLLQRSDVPQLAELDSAITSRLYDRALTHCTFELGDDLEKNSPRNPTDSSP